MVVVVKPVQPDDAGWYRTEYRADTVRLVVGGAWIISEARRLDPLLKTLNLKGYARVEVDCGALSRLDTVGAWLLLRTKR